MGETANFVWDDEKERWNLRERGLAFTLAELMLVDPTLVDGLPTRSGTDTARFVMMGRIDGDAVLGSRDGVFVCVYAWRGKQRRIISLRPASRKERHAYRARSTEAR